MSVNGNLNNGNNGNLNSAELNNNNNNGNGNVNNNIANNNNNNNANNDNANANNLIANNNNNNANNNNEPIYVVVRNAEEQYSIWPAGRDVPAGWDTAGTVGTKDACLAHITEAWTDMRPLSLRRRMELNHA